MFNFYSFFIYVSVTTFTPGPNNIMSMSNSVRLGVKKSFPFNLGVFAGVLAVMFMSAVFSSALFNHIPKVKIYMLTVGAAYMLYLAWKIFKSGSEIKQDENSKAGFLTGALLQFVNPKLFIYAMTVMSTYVIPAYGSGVILAGFSFLLAFICLISTIVWALFGAVFCKLLHKHSAAVNSIMSLLLVYCAVTLFL
ncbi:MAG: LysE family transporter [Synergistaceae bacterium]|nr:LysE family transporter [Synergistaceae bacterium]